MLFPLNIFIHSLSSLNLSVYFFHIMLPGFAFPGKVLTVFGDLLPL